MPLSVHEQAPDFSLLASDGQIFSLSSIKGKPCILYFYPKDFSAVCSAEACEFRDNFAEFRGLDVAVYGISRDDVATHARFRLAHQLPFELLADTEGKVAEAYKALVPIIKLTRRITYLLDSEHKIVAVYENMFNARNHIQRMLAKMQH